MFCQWLYISKTKKRYVPKDRAIQKAFYLSYRCRKLFCIFTKRYGPRQANLVLIAFASREGSGQKARSLAPLNGWACAVKICHDGMLEDTNSLDGAHILPASEEVYPYHADAGAVMPRYAMPIEPRETNLCLRAFRHDIF